MILRVYVIDDEPDRRAEAVEKALAAGAHAVVVAASTEDLTTAFGGGGIRAEVERWFAVGTAGLDRIEKRLADAAGQVGKVVAPLVLVGCVLLGWAQDRATAADEMRREGAARALAEWAAAQPGTRSPGS